MADGPLNTPYGAWITFGSNLPRYWRAALVALRAELIALRESELKPHFRLEENALLPQIAAAGGKGLARRTRREHAVLLTALGALDPDDPAGFAHFGALLAAHVRFEERELFPWCERHLTAEQFDAIARFTQDIEILKQAHSGRTT